MSKHTISRFEYQRFYLEKNTADRIKEITEKEFLMVFEGVDQYKISKSTLLKEVDIITLLVDITGIFKSKGEARRLLQSNAISINKAKCQTESLITNNDLLNNKYLLVQKWKKHYSIICAE